jgi:hypothetical protein
VKVYVASAFANAPRVSALLARLQSAGLTVTHDWTTENTASLSPIGRALYLEKAAELDARGVRICDVFVLIDDPKCRGAYTELGIAIGLHKRIFVLGLLTEPNIFLRLPGITYCATEDDLLQVLSSP